MLRAIYTLTLFIRDFIPLLNSTSEWRLATVKLLTVQTVILLSASLLLASRECDHVNLDLLRFWR